MQEPTDRPWWFSYYVAAYFLCLGVFVLNYATAISLRQQIAAVERSGNIDAMAIKPSLERSRSRDHRMVKTFLFESLLKTESFEVMIDAQNGRLLGISGGWSSHGIEFELVKLCTIVALFGWVPLIWEAAARVRAKRRRG